MSRSKRISKLPSKFESTSRAIAMLESARRLYQGLLPQFAVIFLGSPPALSLTNIDFKFFIVYLTSLFCLR